jgi:Icc-related predicted phosphoesterase
MKDLKSLVLTSLILLAGCAQNSSYLKQRDASLKNTVYPSIAKENPGTGSFNKIQFGIVADIHGESEKAVKIAREFKNRKVDGIIIAGDISRYFSDSKKVPEETEIKDSLIPFLETEKPVYVIAGNHETQNVYFKTLGSLAEQYDNLFDLATLKYVDLDGVNIFGVCGGTITPRGGFSVKKEAGNINQSVFSLDNDPVLMVSHMPPRFSHPGAIDCVYDVVLGSKTIKGRHKGEQILSQGEGTRENPRNKGVKELTYLIQQGVDFSVSGHYHMNSGADDFNFNIPQNTYSRQLFMNPGAAQYDFAAIFTIDNKVAKYELLKIN